MKRLKKTTRPAFIRQESWRYRRVGEGWRRPRGKSSRMRRSVRGHPRLVKIGHGGPSKSRGLHPSGYRELLVHNPEELLAANPEKEVVRIASRVGEKKKLMIMARAEELKIKVLNPPKAAVEGEEEPAEPEEGEAAEEGERV